MADYFDLVTRQYFGDQYFMPQKIANTANPFCCDFNIWSSPLMPSFDIYTPWLSNTQMQNCYFPQVPSFDIYTPWLSNTQMQSYYFPPMPSFNTYTPWLSNTQMQNYYFPPISQQLNPTSLTENSNATQKKSTTSSNDEKQKTNEKPLESVAETEASVESPQNQKKTKPEQAKATCTENDLNDQVVELAQSYVGNVANAQVGREMFTPKENGKPWHNGGYCADFASYVTTQVYGDKLPAKLRHNKTLSYTITYKENAKAENCWLQFPKSASREEKVEWVHNNVKPGQVFITHGSGVSGHHAAVVKGVDENGNIQVVSANSIQNGQSGIVRNSTYKVDDFIRPNVEYGIIDVTMFA